MAKPPARKKKGGRRQPPTAFEQLRAFGITKKSQIPFIVPKAYDAVGEPCFVFHTTQGAKDLLAGRVPAVRVLVGGIVGEVSEPSGDKHPAYYFQLQGLSGSSLTVKVTTGDTELKRRAVTGASLFLAGDMTVYVKDHTRRLLLSNPEIVSPVWFNRTESIYKSRIGLSASKVRDLMTDEIHGALRHGARWLRERLHVENLQEERSLLCALQDDTRFGAPLPAFETLLYSAHNPKSPEHGEHCVLLLRRLMALEMLQDIRRSHYREPVPGSALDIPPAYVEEAIAALAAHPDKPIAITEEQRVAIDEILEDLRSDVPMQRMLSGDTGSGKTVAFLVPCVAAARAGYRVAIQVPNTLIATQHYNEVLRFWPQLGPQLFTGASMDASPTSNFLIGTTALHFRVGEEWVPNLVVADEQHKFGTDQRSFLLAPQTNLLEATATCIPRSQALIRYDGMDVSILRECHVKKDIITQIIPLSYGSDEEVVRFRKLAQYAMKEGKKLLVVYPWVDSSDKLSEEKQKRALLPDFPIWEQIFGDRVRMVHGRMSEEEKLLAVADVASGKADALIGTKVIEFGIDLPACFQCVIFDPDAYGLAALHQIRGRLVRRGGKGFCFLHVNDALAANTDFMERLEAFAQMKNGFDVADIDLTTRKMGDVRDGGSLQSGNYAGFLVGHTVADTETAFIEKRCWKYVRWADRAIPVASETADEGAEEEDEADAAA